jgi:hypothetical protein
MGENNFNNSLIIIKTDTTKAFAVAWYVFADF